MWKIFILFIFTVVSSSSIDVETSTRSLESYLFIVDPEVDPSKYITEPRPQENLGLPQEKVSTNPETPESSKKEENQTISVNPESSQKEKKEQNSTHSENPEPSKKEEISTNPEPSKNETSKENSAHHENPGSSQKEKKEEASIWPPTGKPKPSEQLLKPQRQAILPLSLGTLGQGFGLGGLNLGGLNIGSHSCDRIKLYLSIVRQNENVETTQLGTHCLLDSLALRIAEAAPLKTHKYFRIAVPQALTGQTLVQIVQELIHADDSADALHIATLLLHYGYIFPVIEQSTIVKDDNTLYRIQLPYFWPSHAQNADNVEYAIYLNKRLMRNELKHGLEEDEVEAYNKLVELLGHMWGFITVQAEMQLKIQKERKKSEKVVFDSEERAFWRQRRPGTSNCLEQPIQKIERKLRKCTAGIYREEIERLKFSLKTKPWLKSMKGSETMVNWCSQFHEYDAFITASTPANPWISDDISLWVLNTDLVEVPTEKRVRRWAINVVELTRDPIGRQVLETFLESEFSSENIRFWMAIQDLKYSPNHQIEAKSQRVHDEFLASGAPCQINIDSRTLEATLQLLKDEGVSKRFAFSQAEENVFTLMSKDSYPRFIRSQIYKGVLSAAQQQGSKRLGWRNFIFNMGMSNMQKRAPLTSKHKVSRDDNSHSTLPKQLSSDSLPLKPSPQTFPQQKK